MLNILDILVCAVYNQLSVKQSVTRCLSYVIVFSLVIQDTVPVSQWDCRYDHVYDVFKVSVRKETIILMYMYICMQIKLASRSDYCRS